MSAKISLMTVEFKCPDAGLPLGNRADSAIPMLYDQSVINSKSQKGNLDSIYFCSWE